MGSNQPDMQADFDCSQATAPALFAPTQSTPFALVSYRGEAFPHLRGDLLIALAGSLNNSQIRGFLVSALDPTRADGRIQTEVIVPSAPALSTVEPIDFYDVTGSIVNEHANRLNRIGVGIYPHRTLGLAVSAEGWIYMMAGGGSLYVLRPNDYDICLLRECE
jgi:hypothetical protein